MTNTSNFLALGELLILNRFLGKDPNYERWTGFAYNFRG